MLCAVCEREMLAGVHISCSRRKGAEAEGKVQGQKWIDKWINDVKAVAKPYTKKTTKVVRGKGTEGGLKWSDEEGDIYTDLQGSGNTYH